MLKLINVKCYTFRNENQFGSGQISLHVVRMMDVRHNNNMSGLTICQDSISMGIDMLRT